jgi:hypothetical protein
MKTIEMTTTGKVLEWLTNATSYNLHDHFGNGHQGILPEEQQVLLMYFKMLEV